MTGVTWGNKELLGNLVAWNFNYPQLPFSYPTFASLSGPAFQLHGLRGAISDVPYSLWFSGASVSSNAAFDFFMVPMPQAGSARIVFTSNRDGRAQIYSMDANGGNVIRLTDNGTNDDHPRWSPNGTKILFHGDRDNPEIGAQDIYLMNADGTGQTRLTTDAADDCNAVWSPDGNKIVFQSLRNGIYYQVYTMNADGTGQINLSNGMAADYQSSWSPEWLKDRLRE